MKKSNVLTPVGSPVLVHAAVWLAMLGLLVTGARAASPYAGFYTGYVYSSISGTITVPESAIGAAAFTVDSNGNITGGPTGTVDGSGNITWNANATGFTTGTINGGVLAATTSQNNGGAITTTRIAANNSAGGFGGAGTVAQSLNWRVPTPTGANMKGVTHGAGKFLAVGSGGSVVISGDGTNWLAVNSSTTKQLNAVAHGNGVYVAVGDGATVISSPDGLTWTARSLASSPLQNFVGVAFGNGTFVAVNLVNEVFTSTDGIAWTKVVNSSASAFWNNLKYVGGMFVLVGQSSSSGRIATSANGSTWNTEKLLASTSGVFDVSFGNGKWVGVSVQSYFTWANADASDATAGAFNGLGDAVGFVNGVFVSDNCYVSTNGTAWSRGSYPIVDINDMVTANNTLVAVGSVVMTTGDGRAWAVHTRTLQQPDVNNQNYNNTPVSGEVWDEIQYYDFQSVLQNQSFGVRGVIAHPAYLASLVSPTTNTLRDGHSFFSSGGVAVGENGTIVRCSSGQNAWTNVPSGTTVSLRSIAASADANVVVVGGGGTILRSVNSGQSWSGVASGTTENLNRVVYTIFNYFVAVGDNGVIRKSTNGTTWTTLTSGTSKRLVSIGYPSVGNVKLVALAEDSTVLVSENHGTNWSAITVNIPRPVTYGSRDGTTGYAQDGIRMTSIDSTNWSYTLPSVSGIFGLGYGNGRFVALAGLNRMTSPDLVNWSIATTTHGHNAVTFGNGLLVSVGEGNNTFSNGFVSVSMDGSRWLPQTTPTQVYLNAVTYAQGKFVAVGANGTILTSTNGMNWANRTTGSTSAQLRDVAYGNGLFTAIGTSSLLRYSTDGETWVTTGGSSASLKSVTFAKGLFVAVGDNGAIRTSVNGIDWTSRSTSPSTFEFLNAVKYAGDRFVAVGYTAGSGEGAVVLHSQNGTNWTREVSNIPSTLWTAVAAAGQYVAASDSAGVIVSAPYQSAPQPVITGQPSPAGQTVNAGTTVSYTVTATGTNLQYRWLNNGSPMSDGPGVSGSGTATLTLTGVDVLDATVYHVSVWNDNGSALSQPVSLGVSGPPVIVFHPVSLTVSNLQNAQFTAAAVGPAPLTYQWRFNGQPIVDGGKFSGALTSQLVVSNAVGTNEGAFDVIASNPFGASAPSNPAQLRVNRPPTITQQPVAQVVYQGQTLTLTVVADGTQPLTYQWRRDGTNLVNGGNLSGVNTSTLVIQNAQLADAQGNSGYSVVVNNAFAPGATSSTAYPSVIAPGALRPDFVTTVSGTVNDIAPAANGDFLLAGDLFANGSDAARVRADGTVVTNFVSSGSGGSAVVTSVRELLNGQAFVGGFFSTWQPGNRLWLVRLNTNGSTDTNFTHAIGSPVKRILRLADGKLLVASGSSGFNNGNVHRFNADGTADGTFTTVTLTGQLFDMALQSDGRIIVSGAFGLRRINADGTGQAAFGAAGANIPTVHVGPDDKVYFSDNNGTALTRFNADGTADSTFSAPLNGHVFGMAFLSGGRMAIVGSFNNVNGTLMPKIALLESNGVLTAGFTSTYPPVFGNVLYAIRPLGDGTALVGGNMQLTLPTTQRGLQRVQLDAVVPAPPTITQPPQSIARAVGATATFTVQATGFGGPFSYVWKKDGVVLVNGGAVSGQGTATLTVGNVQTNNAGFYTVEVSSLNGTTFSTTAALSIHTPPAVGIELTLNPAFNANVPLVRPTVLRTAASLYSTNLTLGKGVVQPDGKVLVVGTFEYAAPGGGTNYSIIRLNADGTLDNGFTPPLLEFLRAGAYFGPARITDVALLSDGRIALVGEVSRVAGVANARVVLLNANGTRDTGFAPAAALNNLFSVAVDAQDRIVVSGYLPGIAAGGGATHKHVSRLLPSGAYDTSFNTGSLAIDETGSNTLLIHPDGKIIIFAYTSVYADSKLIRLLTNGTVDGTFTSASFNGSPAYDLQFAPAGGILVPGRYPTIAGQPRRGMARLLDNGSLDTTFGNTATNNVTLPFFNTAVGFADGSVLLAGSFTNIGGTAIANLAMVNGDGTFQNSIQLGTGLDGTAQFAFADATRSAVFVCGAQTSLNGTPVPRIFRLNAAPAGGTSLPLQILSLSPSQAVPAGASHQLAVVATGSGSLAYQWRKDGVGLAGEVSSQLFFPNVQVPQTGSYTVVVTDNANSITSSVVNISLAGPSPTFAEWKADKGLPVGQDGPGDDPDGDGLSNVVEFAFGTHPMQSQSRVLPANRTHSEGGENYPALSFIRRKNLNGASIVVDAFTSIPFGSAVGTMQVGQPEDLGDGTERVTIRSQTPLRSLQRYFFRTRVQVP